MAISFTRVISAGTSAVLFASAIVVTALVVRREFASARVRKGTAMPAESRQPDWRSYSGQGRRLGPPGAPVALVEFADFECPACRVLEERLAESRQHVKTPFAVVYRHLPLDLHPLAVPAAVASECAGAQGRFAEMHDSLFRRQNLLRTLRWRTIASDAGVKDLDAFDRCMSDSTAMLAIRRDVTVAKELHATGTPLVLIDGIRVTGTIAQQRLDSLIESAVRSAP